MGILIGQVHGYDGKRYASFKNSWFEKSTELWSWLGKQAKNAGARLMLENVYEEGPHEMAALFERLREEEVGFCFDTGYQAAFSITATERWLETLGVYLEQVHIHDNYGTSDQSSPSSPTGKRISGQALRI